ncbi:arf-GAP with GTPase, ANK repeat and PH domain-containing protein 1-like isoform X1 [Lytechinus variegatus]|uniref:arf-GAP with GTPase, ANK repeat and PH domain-containing protein 1-like isoform X1 n=1 Tax=Lytechinus variegatus TaxID=7654 RepID=UPI001BB1F225|nr:arf-GAP with GTPase, ANK repeat and PH domain-containing protein 1-like isoform X1 [Lytechinus variegatus]
MMRTSLSSVLLSESSPHNGVDEGARNKDGGGTSSRRSLSFRRKKRSLSWRKNRCLSDIINVDSFVNSQEWTLSRTVPELKLGVVGSLTSGKSALVHRYLTGSYMQEESPEGGRFKKEIVVDDRSYLLLIRDEGGPPELQFCSWVDAVILVFSVEDEMSFNMLYNFYAKIAHYRNTADLPMILVGTQDALTQNSPRLIDDTKAKKLAADLKRCPYFETCAMYGLNVERVFQDAAQLIVEKKHYHPMVSLSNSSSSLPSTPHSVRSNPFPGTAPFPGPNTLSAPSINQSNSQHHQQQQQGGGTTGSMGSRKGSRDSIREGSQGSNQGSDRGPLQPSPSSTPNFTRKSRRKSNLFTPNKGKPQNTEAKNGGAGDSSSLPNHSQRGIGSGRSIPVKQGYLYKRSSKALNKEWKKKYVTLCDDGRLTYHPSLHDYMDDVHGKEIRLLNTTVKVPGRRPPLARANTQVGSNSSNSGTNGIANNMKAMTLSGHAGPGIHSNQAAISRDTSNPMLSQREVQEAKTKSTSLPRDTCFSDAVVISNSSVMPSSMSNGVDAPLSFPQMGMTSKDGHGSKKKHRRMRSSGGNKSLDHHHLEAESEDCEFVIVSLDNRQWNFEATSSEERDGWVVAVEQRILACLQTNESAKGKGQLSNLEQSAIVETIRKVRGNGSCVDCEAQNPDWASLNLGSLMCIECSGIHRNLGSHISRVRSLTLDGWPPELAQVMMLTGNALTNSVFEVSLHSQSKPSVTSGREEKEKWIRAKYEKKEFIAPYPYPERNLGQQLMEAVIREDIRAVMLLLAHAQDDEVNYRYGDGDGRSALHLSCAMGNVVITQLLIWYKLNVNIMDSDGRTALGYARSVGADDCAKVLVMNGCHDNGDLNSNMNNSTLLRVPRGPGRGHHLTGDKISSVI